MLPVVLAATFMYGFDQNVVNVALPTLRTELHAGPIALELVVGGYAFAYAAGLVTGGRLGDLFSYKRMFLIGLAAFTAASVLCGLARTPAELVGGRLLQGLSAAMLVPQVLALITSAFPVAERTAALAWFGVTGAVSGVIGQVLGGFLLDAYSWRVLFLLNLPVGAVVLVLAARTLPGSGSGRRPALDPVGLAAVSSGVALALVPLVLGRDRPWTWALLALAVPVLWLALAYESRLARRGGSPLVDLTLFTGRAFSAGLGIAVAFMAFFTSSFFVLSLLLQTGLGLSPLRAGLSFTPFALLAIGTALTGRRLITRYGPAAVIRAGCAISAAGLVPLTLTITGGGHTVGLLVAELAVVGAGNSLIMTAYLGATLAAVRPDQAGIASGTLNTIQQFAGSAGLAAIGAVFFGILGNRPTASHYAHATAVALWIGVGLVALIAGLTWLLPGRAPAGEGPAARLRPAAPIQPGAPIQPATPVLLAAPVREASPAPAPVRGAPAARAAHRDELSCQHQAG
jgi:EmrB/QacA subfamily drug resistance transporter